MNFSLVATIRSSSLFLLLGRLERQRSDGLKVGAIPIQEPPDSVTRVASWVCVSRLNQFQGLLIT